MSELIKKAFTLIELLVVIAIIGILSGLIVVSMGGMTQKATIAKAQVFSNSLRNSLMTNVAAEYKFDEGLGTAVADSWNRGSSCSWNGSAAGTYTTVPGWKASTDCVSSNCLAFDGTDDYVNCGTGANLNISDAITIGIWVKISTFKNWNDILDKLVSYNPPNNGGYFLGVNSDKKVNYQLGIANDWFNVSGNKLLNTDSWTYITLTYNGSLVTGYINGDFDGSWARSGKIGTNNNNLHIGARSGLTSNHYFNGFIDEARIYSVAIPVSQIKENYYAGLNGLLANGAIAYEEYLSRIDSLAKF